jgi:diaminopimelate decarboxylase
MSLIEFAQHAPIDALPVVDGQLAPGGVPVRRLAERIGRTPFYAYDRGALSARVASLRATLPPSLHLHYAMKANPMPAVVAHLAAATDGMDVASVGEMDVALNAGVAPERISFAGPGKSAGDVRRAVAAGITVTAESPSQYRLVLDAAEALGVSPRLALRVNPSFELKLSGMRMGGGPKPFGMDEQIAFDLARAGRSAGVRLVGLHVYSGSQNLRAEAILESQQRTVELALRLAEQAGPGIEWLNIGGGFGVPYFPGDRPLDLAPIAGPLATLCERARAALGVPLVIELGRYLTAEAGVYVCRILDRKVSSGQVYLVTDGGLHHHLAASGNFGQVLRKNYPVAIADRIGAPALETPVVVGPLCTPLDVLSDRAPLARAEPGDLVAVFMSGAYGLTASPTAFLSHPAPAEVLV